MMIDEKVFRAKVNALQNLPAFPGILDKFNELVKDPKISMNQIGDLISKDQLLSVKILKLVNSAFYGFPGRISTITHALVLLGYDVVKGLILSASVFDIMFDKWQPLWRHSLGVSKACGLICNRLKVENAEEISMAGLLHDIGKVVFLLMEPDIYGQVKHAAEKRNRPIVMAEQTMLGFNHADVASWLCEKWHLPQRLSTPMAFHHNPDQAPNAPVPTAVLFLADNLVKALGYGTEPLALVEPMPESVTKNLAVTHQFLADVTDVLEAELVALGV